MNTLIIVSSKKNKFFYNFILTNLMKKFSLYVVYYNNFEFYSNENKNILNLIFVEEVGNIELENAIVLLVNPKFDKRLKTVNKNTTFISSEENIINLIEIQKFEPNIYTYGFSEKNHITFSSNKDNSAAICLLRNVLNIDHDIIEPLEVVLQNTNNLSNSEILGATLIFLIYNILNI